MRIVQQMVSNRHGLYMFFYPCLWKVFGFLKRHENVQNEFVAVERGKLPTNPDFTQPVVLVVLFSRKSHMNDNHWQTGGMEVVAIFTHFLGTLMLFTRGCLPLGQQYPPFKPEAGSLLPVRREGSTSAFRNRIACPDDAGHRDVTSCKTREV